YGGDARPDYGQTSGQKTAGFLPPIRWGRGCVPGPAAYKRYPGTPGGGGAGCAYHHLTPAARPAAAGGRRKLMPAGWISPPHRGRSAPPCNRPECSGRPAARHGFYHIAGSGPAPAPQGSWVNQRRQAVRPELLLIQPQPGHTRQTGFYLSNVFLQDRKSVV